jgi:hypothetical protein|tara:strand:- start:558 stop:842 length:285 start_codon:yes stop_codon:yes gene_type:complete
MVKKQLCDKCGKEIKVKEDKFAEMFNEISKGFEEVLDPTIDDIPKLLEPDLCRKCQRGFNDIMKDYIHRYEEILLPLKPLVNQTNEQIASYLKE